MQSTPLDFAHTEKPQQIQENLIAYMRLFGGLPNIKMVDTDTFWFVSHLDAPGNNILRTGWSAEGVEERIDALLQEIGQHLDHIDWFVFPGDEPADLGQRLEARGMLGGPGGNWLWADLSRLSAAPSVADNFRIEQVRDDAMMAEWVRISEEGFENNNLSAFYNAYARHGYGGDAFSLHYTGYVGDKAVTSGTLLDAGGWATIYDLSTPPDFRRQGFGSVLTHYLMQETRNRGYGDTWIWSSNMAKSTYHKLGFVDADFGVREHSWKRTK